ncbi:MAG: stage V sporulation protein AD, partial [Dethiobacteria bacterium]
MLQGHQSWVFNTPPVVLASAAVGGPFEARGALAADFDLLHDDLYMGENSFEKAERKLLEEACCKAMEKAGRNKEEINFFLSGDLINQIISSSFTARTLSIPYLGIFAACSSSMEGLALASLLVDS